MLHTAAEYRSFIANVILRDCEVTVAEDETGIVSFLARRGEEVRLLYTRPDRVGRGAGTLLVEAAKNSGVEGLELWRFQANSPARPSLLRSARLSRDPLYRRRGQRGEDTRCPLPLGMRRVTGPAMTRNAERFSLEIMSRYQEFLTGGHGGRLCSESSDCR
jgi:hypothetical protein